MTLLNEADAIYVGGAEADAVYLGDTKVWPAAAGDVAWTPDMLSGLEAWFDATQDAFSNGQLIASYPEHSSHARTFTASAGQEPTFRASIAGKPRLEFGGAVRGLTLGSFSASSLGLNYVICDQTLVTTYIGMLMTYNGTANSYEMRYSDYSLTPMLVANYGANGGPSVVVASSGDTPGIDHLHMAEFISQGPSNLWRDGALLGTGATTAAQATTASNLNLGKRDDAGHYLSHYINEALVINGPINTDTRQRIEGYFHHKWGSAVPSGHPYESTPPLAVAAPSGSLLTAYTPGTDRNDFSGEVGVRLGIGTAPLTVRWLGARCNGYSGTRTVKLYEWFGDTVVFTATIDYTGKALGEYAWTAITPVTLAASGYYALLMSVTASDGMWWTNPGATTFRGMANIYDCYRVPGGGLSTGGINAQFVGLDLGW